MTQQLRRRGRGGAYSNKARELAREMTAAGCSREKVGRLIQLIGRTFGIDIKGMSRRTVSRVIIEGWVASKVQLAHEIKNSEGVTISQDSTSHRKQNYEAHHIIPKVPDYDELKQLQDSGDKAKLIYKPRARFVSLDATLDHSSQGSIDSWKVINNKLSELFNRSPFARRLNQKFTIRDFLLALKGMCGDHANNEKATAHEIQNLKKEASIEHLGEKKINEKSPAEIVFYLAAWNAKKLEEVGGIDAWNCLSPREQAVKDSSIAQRLITELGQAEYDSLGVDERREIDLFIWSGCCMHKDLNSFKGGNSEMMGEWERLGVDRPVLLANKGNAAILQRVLDPGANFGKLTEDQQRAFLESTRGGVKAMDLMGALLNNKDDKKGQGDIHVNYFKKHLGKDHPRFPPTNNTRFSSHGLAAAEVIKYLSLYRKFINEDIPYSKTHPTRTNLEVNIARALSDDATITELCAMVVYMNTISQPYLRVVRGEDVNALDLGPLHAEVKSHINKILDEPSMLFDASETLCLDGKDWEDPDAMKAVRELSPRLPHFQNITLAFIRGSLATWERFSSEFAPGGLIDEATPAEKLLAWRPATNDINEGILGYYRVTMRGKPSLTLHQFNAMAMYERNDTLSFMNALFEEEDYQFIRKVAREIDSSGLEAKRREAQVQFRRQLVEINLKKEEARKQKAREQQERMKSIPLIRDISELDGPPRRELDEKGSGKWTGYNLDLQLDAL
ncbi:hypothetical protein F5878DRAFT_549340 [Lentinula raphanica]|uniref:Uncharacterized protein n=1 Tax=Lentinula raphanica TaxID=153919 RepID=A0AA38NW05_9AGAR|nr:hypothetical protein F5878DRAFT_549340 [Lentinula raphanica]